MKIRYKCDTEVSLTKNKLYEVIMIEAELYRIVDDTGEDYMYYPEMFEVVEK